MIKEKLTIRNYVNGTESDPYFYDINNPVIITKYEYSALRMGIVPSLSATLMFAVCLDNEWDGTQYVMFNGDRYFITSTPSSSKDNTDARYKHEIQFLPDRNKLTSVFFFDVPPSTGASGGYYTNSTTFSFYDTINVFADRLNQSLIYSGLDYRIIVDEGVTSDPMELTFNGTYFADALTQSFDTFQIPFYFKGKEIHFGDTSEVLNHDFQYGHDNELLSISKNNANFRVLASVTGTGSADNIPAYYPNLAEKATIVDFYRAEQLADATRNTTVVLQETVSSVTVVVPPLPTTGNLGAITTSISLNATGEVSFAGSPSSSGSSGLFIEFVKEEKDGTLVPIATDILYAYANGDKATDIQSANRTWTNVWDNGEPITAGTYHLKAVYHGLVYEEGNSASCNLSNSSLTWSVSNGQSDKWITPVQKLMPSIFRESKGVDRFYKALNNTYINPTTGEHYVFDNEFTANNPRQGEIAIDHIKPTIIGVTNASGQLLGSITEFAYDVDDNDNVGEDGNYEHSYFYAKLKKFDGEFGFNLFDSAIRKDGMALVMQTGNMKPIQFTIGATEKTFQNPVQVDSNGNLMAGNVGTRYDVNNIQPRQQNTMANEVWIALKKDEATMGFLMPSVSQDFKPTAGDEFVFANINLPLPYVTFAENRLTEEIIKYMSENNSDKFNFSLKLSRIFLAENPNVLAELNENSKINVIYNNQLFTFYISSYQYRAEDDSELPNIEIDISDTVTANKSGLQKSLDTVKKDIKQTDLGYLRKDIDDTASGHITFRKGLSTANFVSGMLGYGAKITEAGDAEFGAVFARTSFTTPRLVFNDIAVTNGEQWFTDTGKVEIIRKNPTFFITDKNGKAITNETGRGFTQSLQGFLCEFVDSNEESINPFDVNDILRGLYRPNRDSAIFETVHYKVVTNISGGHLIVPIDGTTREPSLDMILVRLGNYTNTKRQGSTYIGKGVNGDYQIKVISGVNSTVITKDNIETQIGDISDVSDREAKFGIYAPNLIIQSDNVDGLDASLKVLNDSINLKVSSDEFEANKVATSAEIKVVSDGISLKVSQTDYDANNDNLLATGIDIENKKVTVTTDSFKIQDTSGTPIAVFEKNTAGQPVLKAENIDVRNLVVANLDTRGGGNHGFVTGVKNWNMVGYNGQGQSVITIDNGESEQEASISVFNYDLMNPKTSTISPDSIEMISRTTTGGTIGRAKMDINSLILYRDNINESINISRQGWNTPGILCVGTITGYTKTVTKDFGVPNVNITVSSTANDGNSTYTLTHNLYHTSYQLNVTPLHPDGTRLWELMNKSNNTIQVRFYGGNEEKLHTTFAYQLIGMNKY